MKTRFIIAIVAASAASPMFAGDASAQRFGRGWRVASGLDIEARYDRRDDSTVADDLSDTVIGGLNLWGIAGKGRFGYMAAVDSHFGGGVQGGFAYELDFYPMGLGIRLGNSFILGVMTGVGTSGVTRHIPFAMQFPVQLKAELDLGTRVHVGGFATASWIAVADQREGGTTDAPFGDELRAGVTLRVGKGVRKPRQQWGNGYFIGATWAERLGSREIGGIIGYSISMGAGF